VLFRSHLRQLGLRAEEAERRLPALEQSGHRGGLAAGDHDVAAHGAKAFRVHDVELETAGGWAGGAICPLWSDPELLRIARLKEEGAPSGVAFPLRWPGACVFAPTNATPKTSAASAPKPTFAVCARCRARSILVFCAIRAGSVLKLP